MKEENLVQKIFSHYTDVVILVLVYFILTHPVYPLFVFFLVFVCFYVSMSFILSVCVVLWA